MSRPKGSLNRSTIERMSRENRKGGNVQIMNFEKTIENAPIIKYDAQYNIYTYGWKNLYPFDLISLYNTSVTMKSCVDFMTAALAGEGIAWDEMNEDEKNIQAPNYYTSWFSFIKSLCFDMSLYSAFAFQVIRNKDGRTYSFFHQPVETIRLEQMDEDGVINNAYLCSDWSEPQKNGVIKMPMFGFQTDKEIPMGVPHLFYYAQYNPVNKVYGLPIYASALNCIQAEAKFQIGNLKQITNGFTPAGAITISDVETDEERQTIIRNITNMFTGELNSNCVMINFRNNIEDKPIEWTPFVQNTSNVNLYADATERTINWIMGAFKIPSKMLIGYPADNSGFSDSGSLMEAAFSLYNVNVANSIRREILDVINSMFRLNGVDIEIKLKPLRYKIDDNKTENKIDTSEEAKGTPKTEDEVTEREEDTI